MSASKRQMNWSNVSFTPTGGSVVNITGVMSVKYDDGSSMLKISGDSDRYNSLIVNDFNEPKITVETTDTSALLSLPSGTTGTFVATNNDAKNGSGSGAITYTFLSIVTGNSVQGKHRAYGMGSLELEGYSIDAQTNPLSTSVAS